MGAIIGVDSNAVFNPGNGQTYKVAYGIFGVSGFGTNIDVEDIVDMVDLQIRW